MIISVAWMQLLFVLLKQPKGNHRNLFGFERSLPLSQAFRDENERADDKFSSFLEPNTSSQGSETRRQVIGSLLGSAVFIPFLPSLAEEDQILADAPDFACLSDLPPLADDSVRIYLCRHGQTENNRLRLVQGSRVNPPINDNGKMQAERLGKALRQAAVQPSKFFHSPLLRAQQTAETAAAQLDNTKVDFDILESIREIDFGPTSDGGSVEQARALMVATYAKWALGYLDVKMASDGESGREVLQRVEQAMEDLLREAWRTPSRSIAVVSHSSYLRTLLAVIQNISLANVASIEVKNGSVSVVDIRHDGSAVTLGSKSPVWGGFFSRARSDFRISYPTATAVRINEKRHLGIYAL